MAFRISTARYAGVPATIRVEGRLAGDAVDVLIGACMDLGQVITIDLSEVSYADDAGVRALGELRARGAALQSPRPYLALLLQNRSRVCAAGEERVRPEGQKGVHD